MWGYSNCELHASLSHRKAVKVLSLGLGLVALRDECFKRSATGAEGEAGVAMVGITALPPISTVRERTRGVWGLSSNGAATANGFRSYG